MRRGILCACLALLMSACTHGDPSVDDYLDGRNVKMRSPEKFDQCHGYGCRLISRITLSDATWKELGHIFKRPSKTPEQERERLAEAIGLMETRVGAVNGTSSDVWGTFQEFGDDQLDCVDESTNTTTYLELFQQKGWVKFHDILTPRARMPLISGRGWWHQTGVIRERASGELFAVDSWYEDNGVPPHIVPFDAWKSGWHPVRD